MKLFFESIHERQNPTAEARFSWDLASAQGVVARRAGWSGQWARWSSWVCRSAMSVPGDGCFHPRLIGDTCCDAGLLSCPHGEFTLAVGGEVDHFLGQLRGSSVDVERACVPVDRLRGGVLHLHGSEDRQVHDRLGELDVREVL